MKNLTRFVSPDVLRAEFAQNLSVMYQQEVPKYQVLRQLVANTNKEYREKNQHIPTEEANTISQEHHGAIRLAHKHELATLRRMFAQLGMFPVGYYDLSIAGLPVHSCAFRPIDEKSLLYNPFRMFTSLLRLEYFIDSPLLHKIQQLIQKRQIFSTDLLLLCEKAEQQGGLTPQEGKSFITHLQKIFSWQKHTQTELTIYQECLKLHPLLADIVCFAGPHLNHLTPRTFDIDDVQQKMSEYDIPAKAFIEGPPARNAPILLRQTSFAAIDESIIFGPTAIPFKHTARFGEVEQRGQALTQKGRALYDKLLQAAQQAPPDRYQQVLQESFADFPDSLYEIWEQNLGYSRFVLNKKIPWQPQWSKAPLRELLKQDIVQLQPIIYEDFLPVSAAGIFLSNLKNTQYKTKLPSKTTKAEFEEDLGCKVFNEFDLYQTIQDNSYAALQNDLQQL